MGDAGVVERIAAWEAEGLIDAEVAARLRRAEADRPDDPGRTNPMAAAAALFGPAVTIAEMFGYLGTGFVLAAWYTLLGRVDLFGDTTLAFALGRGLVAVALVLIGARLMRGSARARRAAGAAFVVAAGATMGTVNSALDALTSLEPEAVLVIAAAGGLVAAAAFRRLHPALLTQFGLLGGVTTLAFSIQQLAERALFRPVEDFGVTVPGGPDPFLKVAVMAGWWLLVAVILGLIGRREAMSGMIDADRRSALSRAWAGFAAIVGVAGAITIYRYDPVTFESRRVLEPVIGDLVILLVSGVLLERAFRRDASAFVYPAGLGVIVALTDLNASYLAKATSTEVGLLVEGIILLVAGFGFERLRRRVAGGRASMRAPAEIEPAAAPSPR
ncbi:MAG: hypothetical protein WEF51_01320 [Chloroflexota bacterium]